MGVSARVESVNHSLRVAARRNARSPRPHLRSAVASTWRLLCVVALALGSLLPLAYWLAWRFDLGWF